jgi:hypothetical protein
MPGQIVERRLEHLARLERAGAGRGLAGTQVPHAPGRTVEQSFFRSLSHPVVRSSDRSGRDSQGRRPPHAGSVVTRAALVAEALPIPLARGTGEA